MEEKIEKLEELYKEINELTPDKMDMVVSESIHTFEQILEKLNEGTKEEKEAAMQHAKRLKSQLEKQADDAMQALKISKDELNAYASDKKNFSEEEWAALSKAREELSSYREHIDETRSVEELKEENEKPKKKRAKSAKWLAV